MTRRPSRVPRPKSLATVKIKGRYSEAALRVPSDIAVMIAAAITVANAGALVVAIIAIAAIVAMVVFSA